MKNNKLRSFQKKTRFVFAVAILFFSFFFTQSASAENKTWDNTSGDGLWNTPTNWSTDTVPGASDTAIFAVSNTTNCAVNATLNIGAIQIDSGYSGTVDLSTYTMSTGALTLNGGILEATNSSSITTNSFSLAGAAIFRAPVSLTVNNGNFTITAGTFTHNNGTVTYVNQGYTSQVFSATGTTMYNLVFDATSDNSIDYSYVVGNFTVNNFTLKHSNTSGYIIFRHLSANPVITVNGDLSFPLTAGGSEVYLGNSGTTDISLNLYGNLIMSDSGAKLRTNINFVGSNAQTINQTLGSIYGGTWTVNKTNLADTVTFLSNVNGSQNITLTQGTIDLDTYLSTSSALTLNGGIFEGTDSSQVVVSSYGLATSTFKAPANLTVNNGNFTITAGTFTHNNGTVNYINQNNLGQTFSVTGTTMYNLVFDATTGTAVNQIRVGGTFTVNDFTLKHTFTSGYYNLYYGGGELTTITVNGDLSFPSLTGSGQASLGRYGGEISIRLYGNLIIEDASARLFADVTFLGAGAQTITHTAGSISGGTWTVNKTNLADTVTFLSNVNGSQNITLTQGTIDLDTYLSTSSALTLNGGIFEGTDSSQVVVSSYGLATSTFKAPANLTVNNGNFTITAGTFTHNNGTVNYINQNNLGQTFSVTGTTMYNLVFDATTGTSVDSHNILGEFTVNNLTLKHTYTSGYYNLYHSSTGLTTITVNGDLSFPSVTGSGQANLGKTAGEISIRLYGNLIIEDASAILFADVTFLGSNTQTVTHTAGSISGGTWTVNKTNPTDVVIQGTAVTASSGLTMTKGTYDLAGYNLTSSSLSVSSSSVFRLKGDETVSATPTLNASSTVEYYATTSSRALKNWTYTNSTLKINGAGGTFTLPANSTISTTTILAGTLNLAGFNLTSSLLQNNSTLQLRGSETITVSSSTRTGTMEYIGDGDSALDNYTINNISNLNFNNLSIAPIDSADTYTLPTSLNLSGNFIKTNGIVNATSTNLVLGGSNQIVTVNSSTTFLTLAKTLTSASDTLTFGTTGNLVITGATTLQGTASYPLSLRSSTPNTQWLFDPQDSRSFSYLDVQDSWNLNTSAINSPSITGFVDSGNNTNWGITILPTVTSSSASDISSSRATLNGSITSTGNEDNTIRGFEYGLTTGYGNVASTTGTYGVGDFSIIISDFLPNTTYHFQSFAVNSAGTSFSTDQSFVTLAALPILTISPATSISTTGATLNGNITNIGGENNTIRGFEYGTTTAYGFSTSTTGSYGTGEFSLNISSLSSETLYHYRAFSTNSAGTSFSSDQSFTTIDINSPVITILGDNPAFVNQNAVYTDAGATSADTVDGDLTSSIITTSYVDTSIIGNSSVVYTVSDSSGNSATSTRVVTVLDITTPTISLITSVLTSTSATITWTTNEPATSRVEYGPSISYGDLTTITNLSGTTTHSVIIPNLLACTNYHYRVISTDLSDNTVTSSDHAFSIGRCTGNSTVTASSTEETLTAHGATVILSDLTLEVPADFTATTSSVVFQAKELDQTEFFAVVTAPADFTFAGNFIFNLKTLIDSTTTLPSFDIPLTITMSYDPATLGSITESSLVIYRYGAPTWTPLSSCSVNTTLHTVTCTTTNFSDFGLFGQVAVATHTTTRVSGTHFGCKDPKATNYEFFSSHRQSLCQYALAAITPTTISPAITNPVTIKPLATTTSTTTKYLFTRNLKLYMTGADVKALQQYLNASGFPVSLTGPGSKGAETTMFGAKTQAALIKFQKAKGITPAVGYFGPITRGRLY